ARTGEEGSHRDHGRQIFWRDIRDKHGEVGDASRLALYELRKDLAIRAWSRRTTGVDRLRRRHAKRLGGIDRSVGKRRCAGTVERNRRDALADADGGQVGHLNSDRSGYHRGAHCANFIKRTAAESSEAFGFS